MKRIELNIRDGDSANMILRVVKACEAIDSHLTPQRQKDRIIITIFARDGDGQARQDAPQKRLDSDNQWRMTVSNVGANAPDLPDRSKTSVEQHNKLMREALHDGAEEDSDPDLDYFLLIALSIILAAIGLNSDSAAALIGSMMIAPVLSPIAAVSLGIALGDLGLIRRSGLAISGGLALVLVSAYAKG